MRIKALLVALALAGLVASLALAMAPKRVKLKPETTAATKQAKCDQVELKGSATTGSVTFMVSKANKRGRTLVGTTVTLTVSAGAKIKAKACTTPGSAALTLRDLHVKVSHIKP